MLNPPLTSSAGTVGLMNVAVSFDNLDFVGVRCVADVARPDLVMHRGGGCCCMPHSSSSSSSSSSRSLASKGSATCLPPLWALSLMLLLLQCWFLLVEFYWHGAASGAPLQDKHSSLCTPCHQSQGVTSVTRCDISHKV
jgi:hypothetical protein